ncbi:MAG: 4'-phosphopantetheinyl transferase superfamily protein [Saprospiraceae bacterium]|nr:4'-phosphopantetheinyl transferase superfamily protein [Saprospiraceae bacterium]
MPQILHHIDSNETEVRIWRIEEPESFFMDQVEWTSSELDSIRHFQSKRRLEYLASRFLLYKHQPELSPQHIIRDEFGKLLLKDGVHKISISHSGRYSSYVKSIREVGIDLQVCLPKVLHILPKFLHPEDQLFFKQTGTLSIEEATLAWCAKEAVYKAHGKRNIHFKEQIRLYFKDGFGLKGSGSATLSWTNQRKDYHLYYEIHEDFVWLIARHLD